jgi:hypothetical protein
MMTPDERDAQKRRTQMSENSTRAERIVSDLKAKREALIARGIELGEQRTKVAFAAHADGNEAARKKLDTINREAALHDSELRSLDAAIEEAGERVKQARAIEHAKAERETAAQLKAAAAELRAAGQTADDALAVLVAAGATMHAAIDKIHSLGCSHPAYQQVLSLGERALVTALQQTIWARAFHVLAPRERTRFSDFISQWERSLQNEIARRLGEKQNEEAA